MDLRKLGDVLPHVPAELQSSLKKVQYILDCVDLELEDQQGFLASGVQLYHTNEITIKANIMVRSAASSPSSNYLNENRMPRFLTRSASHKITPSVWLEATKHTLFKTSLQGGNSAISAEQCDSLQR